MSQRIIAGLMQHLKITHAEAYALVTEMEAGLAEDLRNAAISRMEDDGEGENGNLNFAPINIGGGGFSPSIGSSQTSNSGGFTSSGGQNLANVPQATQPGNWGSIVGALGSLSTTTLAKPTIKTDLEYVIVQTDGQCLELVEQSKLTGRELINLCKFFNVVNAAAGRINTNWTDLVYALGIERHFQQGLSDHKHYDMNSDILFIFLFDAK